MRSITRSSYRRCKLGYGLLLVVSIGLSALPTAAQTVLDFSKPQKGPFPSFLDLSNEGPTSEQPNMTNPAGSIFDVAMNGDAAMIEVLLKRGVAVNSRGEGDETALHWA
jgi:hypothetical protein